LLTLQEVRGERAIGDHRHDRPEARQTPERAPGSRAESVPAKPLVELVSAAAKLAEPVRFVKPLDDERQASYRRATQRAVAPARAKRRHCAVALV
jgi:hypothetical protein